MALHARGLGKGDFVAIMLLNRPEHCIADVGSFHAGATGVSVYNTLAEDQIAYVAGNCHAKVAVVDDPATYARWASVRDRLPDLQTIVVVEGAELCHGDGVISWADFLAEGQAHLDEVGEQVFTDTWQAVQPDDVATLIYTSGTTGPPKGVVETHRGVLYIMETARDIFEMPMKPSILSYLPLAHVAERMYSHWQGIKYAAKTHFCTDYTRIAEYLPEAQPTAFLAVPRVWEKMRAALLARIDAAEGPKAKLGEQAFAILPQLGAMAFSGKRPSLVLQGQAMLFEKLVYSKVREALGFGNLQIALTGAAPMPDDLLMFFKGLGIDIMNVYGMTETTAVTNANRPGRAKLGTVGTALPGIEVAIAPDGEIIARGPTMTPEYFERPEATAELFDDDGWLHTGDIARIDADGHVYIVDRLKELIKYKGFQVPPAELEALLLTHPDVADAAVIGLADDEAGEIPVGYVVAKAGASLEPADVMAFVAEQVAHYKQIRQIHVVDEIPKSASGKILRRVLKDQATEG